MGQTGIWGDARVVLFAGAMTGLSFAACASNSQPQGEYCGSPDPCACLVTTVGQICMAHGAACECTNLEDSGIGAEDSGVVGAGDAPVSPDMAAFVGKWSPSSGSGQANCGGQITAIPPNTSAILTFTEESADTLEAASSGAVDCLLALLVSGETATLAQSSAICAVAGGGAVSFSTFTLVFTPGTPEGGAASDGGTLDWRLADTDGNCVTTLHYELVRAQ